MAKLPGGAFVDDVLLRQCLYGFCPTAAASGLQPGTANGLIETPVVFTRPRP